MSITAISGAEIRAFRSSVGLSQAGLARELGCSTRAVEEWEAGRREAPAMLRLALSAINGNLAPWSDPNRPDIRDVLLKARDGKLWVTNSAEGQGESRVPLCVASGYLAPLPDGRLGLTQAGLNQLAALGEG